MRSATINRQSFRLILAVLLLSLTSCGPATNRALEETFEQFYTVEPAANITIKNGDGVVRVYGSSANEMRVQAIKRAYTPERLKQIMVNVSVQPGSVSIETNFPPKPTWALFDRSGTVEYTILVPQTAKISRLESGNGEVLVEGMRGPTVHARLGSGQMFGHNCFSNVVFAMGRGTVTLHYDWWEPGKFSIRADVVDGNARAFFPSGAAFRLIVETLHGKIANDFAEKDKRGSEDTAKLDMLVDGGGDSVIKLQAKEGNIKVVRTNP